MKKILFVIIAFALIFASIGVSAFALTENNTPEASNGEYSENSAASAEADEDDGIDKELEGLKIAFEEKTKDLLSRAAETITNGSLITSVVVYVIVGIVIIGMVIFRTKNITKMLTGKADSAELSKSNKNIRDLIDSGEKRHDETLKKLEASEQKINELYTVLTIFITNAKINPNAKAEIMKFMTGVKDFDGSPKELLEKANRAIEAANAAEEKIETPALDKISEEYQIKLGG